MADLLAELTAEMTAPGQRYETIEEVIGGRTYRIWKNAPTSLAEVWSQAETHGDADYLVYEDERISYAQVAKQVASLRSGLSARGVVKGDRVALAMRNYPEWVASFWAIVTLGAVVVPLNAWWASAELAYGLADSGAKAAIVDQDRMERLLPELMAGAPPELAHLFGVRCEESSLAATRGRLAARGIDATPLATLLEDGSPGPIEVELLPEDTATIFYTSGTTGRPKGALGTHRNICTTLMSLFFLAARSQRAYGTKQETLAQNAVLVSVPLFHATGCHGLLVPNTMAGGKLVMMRRWNPERALELIERERINNFIGVPTMVWQALNSPALARRDTSSLRTVSCGGAPAPPELLRRLRARFPAAIPSNSYGLTETSSVATSIAGEEYAQRPESVGRPLPVVEVRVVGAEGEVAGAYETGELWVHGANVVPGYWNRPRATAAAIQDGWFRTGDLAYLDDEGFVYIVDRAKDVLIRGGENVYSAEVEAAIYGNPCVADAAVIGIPDLEMGEEVAAVVRLHAGCDATEDTIRAAVAAKLAAFKVPKYIFFHPEPLPRNAAGKLLKRQLREEMVSRLVQE